MPTRWSYDILFKLKAVETTEKKSKEAVAVGFQLDPRRIQEWVYQKEKMFALKKQGKSKRKQMYGAGHKAGNPEIEKVFEWICELRSCHIRVTPHIICH